MATETWGGYRISERDLKKLQTTLVSSAGNKELQDVTDSALEHTTAVSKVNYQLKIGAAWKGVYPVDSRLRLQNNKHNYSESEKQRNYNPVPTEMVPELLRLTGQDSRTSWKRIAESHPFWKAFTPEKLKDTARRARQRGVQAAQSPLKMPETKADAVVAAEDELTETDLDYEVERILQVKKRKRKMMYKVKWVGYATDEATWEPETSFKKEVLGDLLRAFKMKKK